MKMLEITKFYLRDDQGTRAVTVMSRPITAWTRSDGGSLYCVQYAVSAWNYKDKFDRPLGDEYARRRLEDETGIRCVIVPEGCSARNIILLDMTTDRNIPHRARRLATKELLDKVQKMADAVEEAQHLEEQAEIETWLLEHGGQYIL